MFLCYKKKATRGIFEEKSISEQFCLNDSTTIQLNLIQLTSRAANHVEITKIVSTSQRESKIIDC